MGLHQHIFSYNSKRTKLSYCTICSAGSLVLFSSIFFQKTISHAKGMHKGTSEAPVLSESERERRSKGISMGRRQA